MRTLAEWLTLQESVHPQSIDMGLERVAGVARTLGLTAPEFAVITVAGTNGKGSIAAHLEALLRARGAHTGLFMSPHLVRYNERIRLDAADAEDAALVAAFERIEAARGATTLTFFEYSTLAALLIFAARAVEVAVLEVGLGGRLDATNLIDAHVAVLASVGLDHRDWLGDTLELIGAEKAGIVRAQRPAVLGTPHMPASVFAAIRARGAQAVVAERDFSWQQAATGWDYRGLKVTLSGLPPSALAGDIQYRNAATALAALEALEAVPGEPEWILDIAHNEPAAQVLAAQLRARALPPGAHRAARTIAVIGVLADKDAAAIAAALQGVIDHWVVCALPGARGSGAAALAARLGRPGNTVTLAASVGEGCERARAQARSGDR